MESTLVPVCGVEAAYLEAHDPVTGLPNRAQVAAALDIRSGEGRQAVLLFVAIIDLFRIDEAFGRDAGDAVLATVARRTVRAAGPWSMVGCVERDVLVVIADGDRQGAGRVRDRLQVHLADSPHQTTVRCVVNTQRPSPAGLVARSGPPSCSFWPANPFP